MNNNKVSKYFQQWELECPHCQLYLPNNELLLVIDDVREHFGKPTSVNSSTRCPVHNAAVGGAPASQHLTGYAADIAASGVRPSDVADYLEAKYPGKFGIGRYNSFTHIDVRHYKARWNRVT